MNPADQPVYPTPFTGMGNIEFICHMSGADLWWDPADPITPYVINAGFDWWWVKSSTWAPFETLKPQPKHTWMYAHPEVTDFLKAHHQLMS